MAKTQILEYTIHLDDKDVADRLAAALASGTPTAETGTIIAYPGFTKFGIYRAPDGAAIEFANLVGAVPFGLVDVGQPIPPHDGGYITSEWFTSSNTFPRDVATFLRSSGWWIFGSNTRFYWAAQVVWSPPAVTTTPASGAIEPTQAAPIPTRTAIISANGQAFSAHGGVAGATIGAGSLHPTRVAKRVGAGLGWVMRNTSGVQEWTISFTGTPRCKWSRFYFKAPAAPSTTTGIWRGENGSVNGTGFGLAVTTQMQVALLNFSAAATYTLVGTFATLNVGEWNLFDVIFDVDAVGNVITVEAYLNHELICSSTRSADGVQGIRGVVEVGIGESQSVVTTANFMFDGLIASEPPKTKDRAVAAWGVGTSYVTGDVVRVGSDTAGTYAPRWIALQASVGQTPGTSPFAFWRRLTDSVDWQNGSLIVLVPPAAFSANHSGNWTGDVRTLMQIGEEASRASISSATSGALAAADLDLERDIEGIPGAIGWVAFGVNMLSLRGSAASGTLGYQLGSASAAVMTAITQASSLAWNGVIATPAAGTNEPIEPGETIELRHAKAADTGTGRVASLMANVEVIGVFGTCDVPVVAGGSSSSAPSTTIPDAYPNGLHNQNYPFSPWHNDRGALGPIVVKSGTYVGNSLGQTLSFPVPPVFMWVRPLTSDSGGNIWWASCLQGHLGHANGLANTALTRFEQDEDFVDSDPDADQQMSFDVHIGGAQSQINNTGVTYQYVAFCDPAARFSRAGAYVGSTLVAPLVHALDDAEFLPEILFAWQEATGTGSTSTLNMQGPGHAAGTVQVLTSSTSIASAITKATGQLTVGSAFFSTAYAQYAYVGFRRADGNEHPDQGKVMFLGNYTGDGAASRTINIAPTTGFRPLWCLVQPANAASIYRDPSNTTNTSNNTAGGTTTTGITAGGIDSFTVGSSLNTNGISYNYFGFFADATAGNGGWGTNGTYTPVPSDSPFPSDWSEPEPIELPGASSSGPAAPPPEQPDLDDDTPLPNTTLFCLEYSTRIVNRALGRIGVSKQVGDLAIDDTQQAIVARLHLKDDVEATLRLFPWAFATAYAELVLHSGTESDAVNEDWQYAYECPVDLVFARRIVPQNGRRRKYDRTPIVFRLGLDQTDGHLIYCNERIVSADVPLQLEYTRRVGCPAYFGDALFREALVWKIASSLAAALSKDAAKAEFCLRAWESFRGKAETAAANEQQPEQGTTGGDAEWISGRGEDDADWIRGR